MNEAQGWLMIGGALGFPLGVLAGIVLALVATRPRRP